MVVKIANLLANLLSQYFEGGCATHILLLISYFAKYEYVNLDVDGIFYEKCYHTEWFTHNFTLLVVYLSLLSHPLGE
jgi:hypothetical protein